MTDWIKFFKDHQDYTVRSSYYECSNAFTLEELYQAFKARLEAEEIKNEGP